MTIWINTKLSAKQRKLLESLRNRVSSRTWEKTHYNTRKSLIVRGLVQTNLFSGQVEVTPLAETILDGGCPWDYRKWCW